MSDIARDACGASLKARQLLAGRGEGGESTRVEELVLERAVRDGTGAHRKHNIRCLQPATTGDSFSDRRDLVIFLEVSSVAEPIIYTHSHRPTPSLSSRLPPQRFSRCRSLNPPGSGIYKASRPQFTVVASSLCAEKSLLHLFGLHENGGWGKGALRAKSERSGPLERAERPPR